MHCYLYTRFVGEYVVQVVYAISNFCNATKLMFLLQSSRDALWCSFLPDSFVQRFISTANDASQDSEPSSDIFADAYKLISLMLHISIRLSKMQYHSVLLLIH